MLSPTAVSTLSATSTVRGPARLALSGRLRALSRAGVVAVLGDVAALRLLPPARLQRLVAEQRALREGSEGTPSDASRLRLAAPVSAADASTATAIAADDASAQEDWAARLAREETRNDTLDRRAACERWQRAAAARFASGATSLPSAALLQILELWAPVPVAVRAASSTASAEDGEVESASSRGEGDGDASAPAVRGDIARILAARAVRRGDWSLAAAVFRVSAAASAAASGCGDDAAMALLLPWRRGLALLEIAAKGAGGEAAPGALAAAAMTAPWTVALKLWSTAVCCGAPNAHTVEWTPDLAALTTAVALSLRRDSRAPEAVALAEWAERAGLGAALGGAGKDAAVRCRIAALDACVAAMCTRRGSNTSIPKRWLAAGVEDARGAAAAAANPTIAAITALLQLGSEPSGQVPLATAGAAIAAVVGGTPPAGQRASAAVVLDAAGVARVASWAAARSLQGDAANAACAMLGFALRTATRMHGGACRVSDIAVLADLRRRGVRAPPSAADVFEARTLGPLLEAAAPGYEAATDAATTLPAIHRLCDAVADAYAAGGERSLWRAALAAARTGCDTGAPHIGVAAVVAALCSECRWAPALAAMRHAAVGARLLAELRDDAANVARGAATRSAAPIAAALLPFLSWREALSLFLVDPHPLAFAASALLAADGDACEAGNVSTATNGDVSALKQESQPSAVAVAIEAVAAATGALPPALRAAASLRRETSWRAALAVWASVRCGAFERASIPRFLANTRAIDAVAPVPPEAAVFAAAAEAAFLRPLAARRALGLATGAGALPSDAAALLKAALPTPRGGIQRTGTRSSVDVALRLATRTLRCALARGEWARGLDCAAVVAARFPAVAAAPPVRAAAEALVAGLVARTAAAHAIGRMALRAMQRRWDAALAVFEAKGDDAASALRRVAPMAPHVLHTAAFCLLVASRWAAALALYGGDVRRAPMAHPGRALLLAQAPAAALSASGPGSGSATSFVAASSSAVEDQWPPVFACGNGDECRGSGKEERRAALLDPIGVARSLTAPLAPPSTRAATTGVLPPPPHRSADATIAPLRAAPATAIGDDAARTATADAASQRAAASAVAAYARHGLWEEALVFYAALLRGRVKVAPATAHRLVPLCQTAGAWAAALRVFAVVSARHRPPPASFTAALAACADGGAWREALAVFAHAAATTDGPLAAPAVLAQRAALAAGRWASAVAVARVAVARQRRSVALAGSGAAGAGGGVGEGGAAAAAALLAATVLAPPTVAAASTDNGAARFGGASLASRTVAVLACTNASAPSGVGAAPFLDARLCAGTLVALRRMEQWHAAIDLFYAMVVGGVQPDTASIGVALAACHAVRGECSAVAESVRAVGSMLEDVCALGGALLEHVLWVRAQSDPRAVRLALRPEL